MNNTTGTTPFVPAPLSPGSEGIRTLPAPVPPAVPGPNAVRPNPGPLPSPAEQEALENLYPDIYRELYPAITDAVERMIAASYTPTPDSIGEIVDDIIKNSGLWFEDDDDGFDMDPGIVPVQFGFGRRPYRRRRRRHHNRNTLRDLARILLLRELFGRGLGYPYPYSFY